MNRPKAATRRAVLAASLLFAAGLFVVGPAEASRTTDARSSLASSSALELASLELPMLEPVGPANSASISPRFGFAEALGLLDPEGGPGGFVVFARETSRCELTYAGNNPLTFVDPDGYVKFYGATAFYHMAEEYLSDSSVAREEFRKFNELTGDAQPTVYILDEDWFDFPEYDPRTNIVYWNPFKALDVSTEGGKPGSNGSWLQSPAMALLHEITHAVGRNTDRKAYDVRASSKDARFDDKEEARTIAKVETPAARQLGEPTRNSHRGRSVTSSRVIPSKKKAKPEKPPCGSADRPCVRKAETSIR